MDVCGEGCTTRTTRRDTACEESVGGGAIGRVREGGRDMAVRHKER